MPSRRRLSAIVGVGIDKSGLYFALQYHSVPSEIERLLDTITPVEQRELLATKATDDNQTPIDVARTHHVSQDVIKVLLFRAQEQQVAQAQSHAISPAIGSAIEMLVSQSRACDARTRREERAAKNAPPRTRRKAHSFPAPS